MDVEKAKIPEKSAPIGQAGPPLPKSVEVEAQNPTTIDPIAKAVEDPDASLGQQLNQLRAKIPRKRIFGGISREDTEYIIGNLSMMLTAGVSVGEALDSIATELSKPKIKSAILKIRQQVDEGMPFSQAIEQTRLFNQSAVTLILIGESTGKLPQNLKVIADQVHKNNVMSSKIKSAMLYPAFLVCLLFAVGTGVGVFLLPRLLSVINSLQVKVGPITRGLIAIGGFFAHWGVIFAVTVAIVVVAFIFAVKLSFRVRAFSEAIMFHIPGIKKLLFQTEIARFGYIFGTLLEAGLPVVAALQSLSGSMVTRRYQVFAYDLSNQIDVGNSFAKILANKKNRQMLSGAICQIVVSAEKSGTLSESLLKIGESYEDKADITAHNLETLLEPIILVIIAVGVLFVALGVFLPIYSLIGNLNASG
ncbi:MAG TPA: type II secretion system F family protein [Candidatus Saccharimonadales bacterium]|nr:type II secretion system F family protein [Candidatus Saccharimonadales bacterium]